MRRALAWVWLAAAALAGCTAPERSPAETVERYFALLARDPIRTLALLTPAFHRQHALRMVTTAEARHYLGQEGTLPDPKAAAGPPVAERIALDRLELAWLAVQARDSYRALAAQLGATPLDVHVDGDRATVTARVEPGGPRPPFEQLFRLVRAGPAAAWRIDGIEQRGVVAGNLAAAFVAHPSEASRERLEAQLRRGAR